MPFFLFRQNNSGGYFDGPAINVIVEAPDAGSAGRIMRANDLDENAPYCECCGTRWSPSFADDEFATREEALEGVIPGLLNARVPEVAEYVDGEFKPVYRVGDE